MLNNIKGCAEALRETAPEIDILINEPMRRHTTFSIGGPADLFILPKTRRELIGALEVLRAQGVPMLLLGNGSNMLVADAGIRGAVVCTSEVDEVRVSEDNTADGGGGRAAQPHCPPRAACRSDRSRVRRRHSGQSGRRGLHECGCV